MWPNRHTVQKLKGKTTEVFVAIYGWATKSIQDMTSIREVRGPTNLKKKKRLILVAVEI